MLKNTRESRRAEMDAIEAKMQEARNLLNGNYKESAEGNQDHLNPNQPEPETTKPRKPRLLSVAEQELLRELQFPLPVDAKLRELWSLSIKSNYARSKASSVLWTTFISLLMIIGLLLTSGPNPSPASQTIQSVLIVIILTSVVLITTVYLIPTVISILKIETFLDKPAFVAKFFLKTKGWRKALSWGEWLAAIGALVACGATWTIVFILCGMVLQGLCHIIVGTEFEKYIDKIEQTEATKIANILNS